MGIWDRLGDVIKSYLNDGDSGGSKHGQAEGTRYGDPDLDAAFEELNEFLGSGSTHGTSDWDSTFARESGGAGKSGEVPPESLRTDFAELGLPFGAPDKDCKQAYKQLLKKHHPDRHAGHEGNMKKATEKSARINAAYDRIQRWREGKR
jgi:DnaJ-domain-containing protein 1